MDPARIAPLLGPNRALREAESPKAGYGQGREQRPEIPTTPHEAGNRQCQQQAAHCSHHGNTAHPAFRQPGRGDVAKPGCEQEPQHAPEIDSFGHAVIPRDPIGSSSPSSPAHEKRAARAALVFSLFLFYQVDPIHYANFLPLFSRIESAS